MTRRVRRCGGFRFVECMGHGDAKPHIHVYGDSGGRRLGTWSIGRQQAEHGLSMSPRLRRCLGRLGYMPDPPGPPDEPGP